MKIEITRAKVENYLPLKEYKQCLEEIYQSLGEYKQCLDEYKLLLEDFLTFL